MDYVTVRQLRAESGKIWDRIEAGEELVVIRNGKPFALLLPTDPATVKAALRAHRGARLGAMLDHLQAYAKARGLDRITEEEIEAEIAAARKERKAVHAKPRGP